MLRAVKPRSREGFNEPSIAVIEKSSIAVVQRIPISVIFTIVEVNISWQYFCGKWPCHGPNVSFQVHLESYPRLAAHFLSSCRDLWIVSSRVIINMHSIRMHDFSFWPLMQSTHYHIKGVHLSLHGSEMTDLPQEIELGGAFLHTLDLSKCQALKCVSRFVRVLINWLASAGICQFSSDSS